MYSQTFKVGPMPSKGEDSKYPGQDTTTLNNAVCYNEINKQRFYGGFSPGHIIEMNKKFCQISNLKHSKIIYNLTLLSQTTILHENQFDKIKVKIMQVITSD